MICTWCSGTGFKGVSVCLDCRGTGRAEGDGLLSAKPFTTLEGNDVDVFERKPHPLASMAGIHPMRETMFHIGSEWLLLKEEPQAIRALSVCINCAFAWLAISGHAQVVHDYDERWLRRFIMEDEAHFRAAVVHAPSWLDARMQAWVKQC